jgi:hypothetical protein
MKTECDSDQMAPGCVAASIERGDSSSARFAISGPSGSQPKRRFRAVILEKKSGKTLLEAWGAAEGGNLGSGQWY